MKKLIVMAVAALVAAGAFAQGIGGGCFQLNGDWYKDGSGWAPDWADKGDANDAQLGTIYSLTLGSQVQTYSEGMGATVTLYYAFDDATSFTGYEMGWCDNSGDNGNSVWKTGGNPEGGFTNFTPQGWDALPKGDHSISLYMQLVDANGGNHYDKAGENNHVVHFTKATAVPEPATMSLLGLGALAMVLRRKLRK